MNTNNIIYIKRVTSKKSNYLKMCIYIHTHTQRKKIDANKILSDLQFWFGSRKQNKSAAFFVNLKLMTSVRTRKNRLDDSFIESICIFKATTLLIYSEEKSLTVKSSIYIGQFSPWSFWSFCDIFFLSSE